MSEKIPFMTEKRPMMKSVTILLENVIFLFQQKGKNILKTLPKLGIIDL